jgi:hypothetical protein
MSSFFSKDLEVAVITVAETLLRADALVVMDVALITSVEVVLEVVTTVAVAAETDINGVFNLVFPLCFATNESPTVKVPIFTCQFKMRCFGPFVHGLRLTELHCPLQNHIFLIKCFCLNRGVQDHE